MASYLRPRRGKAATAKSQNIVLKRGEIFFETPTGGVGTGIGKLKMGDGSTSYSSLPYFLQQLDLSDNATKCAFTNVTSVTDKSNNSTYLGNIIPGNSLKTLFQNIKQLLLNYNSQLTSLNNDLTDNYYDKTYIDGVFNPIDGAVHSEYTTDGYLRRQNKTIIIGMNISPGFCNAGQWWGIATLADGNKPEKNLYCNAQGYQVGWSSPTAVACMIQTNGIIYIYSQDNKLTNFTISAVWFTNQ